MVSYVAESEIERDSERDRESDRDREIQRERERGTYHERAREREREKESAREWVRERESEIDRQKDRECARDRAWERQPEQEMVRVRQIDRATTACTGRDGILVVEALLPGVPPTPSRAATFNRLHKTCVHNLICTRKIYGRCNLYQESRRTFSTCNRKINRRVPGVRASL